MASSLIQGMIYQRDGSQTPLFALTLFFLSLLIMIRVHIPIDYFSHSQTILTII